jgi:hypothetical protein
MTEVTAKDVHTMLRRYLRNRSDLGFRKAVAAQIFEPRNPFEPQSIQKPQRWFVLLVVTSLMTIGAFVYFNVWN